MKKIKPLNKIRSIKPRKSNVAKNLRNRVNNTISKKRDTKKIAILGAGAFGFAFTKLISDNHIDKEIVLYGNNRNSIEHIKKTRKHPLFHGNTQIGNHVHVTSNLEDAISDSDLIVMAVPTSAVREFLIEIKKYFNSKPIFLSLTKGIELETDMTAYEIISQVLGSRRTICVLSGGMIAREVTLENPLCADLACKNRHVAKYVAKMLWTDYFRIETTNDVRGVGLSGAFKNVIAIGAGIFDGLGYGESSKSAFVSSTSKEMTKLALLLGAKKETFSSGSQAWFGDLMTTCFGKSRNRELGELIGKGLPVNEALKLMAKSKKSVEGYRATKVVNDFCIKNKVKIPLVNLIYKVLYENMSPKDFLTNFIKNW